MKTLYPQLRLTDPSFNYVSSAKTDIRDTFRRFSTPQNQENNKPLVPPKGISLDKPLVEPILSPGAFVLASEWFELLE
jgi:hypothetical protein